jgi:hypothetical protein
MRQGQRNRARLVEIDLLEGRMLLANVPGNAGQILHSQFQPTVDKIAGWQHWKLALRGPLAISVTSPVSSGTSLKPPLNTGLIANSQFVAETSLDLKAQLKRVHLGGGLAIVDSDPAGNPGVNPVILGVPVNSGNIIATQFNDGGFRDNGLQLRGVSAGKSLAILNNDVRVTPSTGVAGPVPGPSPFEPTVEKTANSNLIANSQFNDGGFGDLGIQWHHVHVRGAIGFVSARYEVQVLPTTPPGNTSSGGTGGSGVPGVVGSPTNTGVIRASQVNDGGFGDIGAQWWNVGIGKNVGTAHNTLSIQPEVNNVGPITVSGLDFEKGLPTSASTTTSPGTAAVAPASVSNSTRSVAATAAPAPFDNEATNSGRLLHAQVSDGAAGDIGLQWRNVLVKGNVGTVHNSLSIQPENVGQGAIVVDNIHFPSGAALPPKPAPTPAPGPLRQVPPDPPLVISDGTPVSHNLSQPTRPRQISSPKNEATNSGTIHGGQFADGGFGDIGEQWGHVRIKGNVGIVHNSLSIQVPPAEGSPPPGTISTASIAVSNVSYGQPIAPGPRPASGADPGLAVLPYLVIPGKTSTDSGGGSASNQQQQQQQQPQPRPSPANAGFMDHRQFIAKPEGDVVFQWSGVHRGGGLTIVHNILTVKGPGTVILSNIRFPGRIPPISGAPPHPNNGGSSTNGTAASAVGSTLSAAAAKPSVSNSATNSGLLADTQFSSGGLGNIGLQWRKVRVHGSVAVVHNVLSVSDNGVGTGPISVSNVTFNSGALNQPGIRSKHGQLVIWPPNKFSRIPFYRPLTVPTRPANPNVNNQAVNSGTVLGGQVIAGGLGHVTLQWRNVGMRGPVTIIDNLLSVTTNSPRPTPITISNVTFS